MTKARALGTLSDIGRTLQAILATTRQGSLRRARALQLTNACLMCTLAALQRIYSDVVLLPCAKEAMA
jgi:hypothetical protein